MSTSQDLSAALTAALAYLIARRQPNGLWSDFRTKAGQSEEWVTAFTIWAVAQTGSSADISVTADILASRQGSNGGWSYNKKIPPDADSTGWALLALSRYPALNASAIRSAVHFLKAHRGTSGGFSTYIVNDGIHKVIGSPSDASVAGWLDPQPCVTALVLNSLLSQGECPENALVRSAAKYLLDKRCDGGLWPSYWWKGYAYCTFLSLRALLATKIIDETFAAQTVSTILTNQNSDGGWNDDSGTGSEVFATAFYLLTLLMFPESSNRRSEQNAAAWLLAKQNADGSWPSAPVLRIPAPFAERPEGMSINAWSTMESGTNIVVEDQHHTYTTSAALWSLAELTKVHT